MRMLFRTLTALVLPIVVVCSFAAGDRLTVEPVATPEQPLRILFIGNSYTNFNNLPAVLSKLAASAEPPLAIETAQYAPDGYNLKHHWSDGEALRNIRESRWDFVVLQEASMLPVENPEQMRQFARKFNDQITKTDARTVLFMTWARQHKPKMITAVARTCNSIGRELNALVAPAGRAWQRALKRRANLVLHTPDKSHPTQQGTYLAACIFYATLTGENPEGLSSAGLYRVTQKQAQFLQQIAWETVKDRLKREEKEESSKANKARRRPDKEK